MIKDGLGILLVAIAGYFLIVGMFAF